MTLRAEVPRSLDLLAVHRRDPHTFPFLLQSAAEHESAGRYDLLLGFPGERLSGNDGFEQLDAARIAAAPAAFDTEALPFVGGWFLLLGYEAARAVEASLVIPNSPFALPDFLAVRCPAAFVYDRLRGVSTLVVESEPAQMSYMRQLLQASGLEEDRAHSKMEFGTPIEDSPDLFLTGVRRIREYLAAGDAFQVNLSRAWRTPIFDFDGATLFGALRRTNPAPFAGLARVGATTVISSSPERLVRVQGDRVETRPIAGTRPRGSGDEDQRLRDQLIGSLKERAEHVMLLDLERNDLGRLCVPGSVEVNELMTLERYAHVHHIVSNVRGRLRPGTGPGAVLKAVFPGGTITGCPKVRAMQIIAELEGVGRGPYTGAMGYLSRCGRLDSNILIRTLVVEEQTVTFRAGAGIVADSDPQSELAETRAKARGLLLALGAAA